MVTMNAKTSLVLLFLQIAVSAGIHAQDWKQIKAGAANGITVLPNGDVVALVNERAYRSTDGGGSWITGGLVAGGFPALRSNIDGSIYSGSSFGRAGLSYSTDGGNTWGSYSNIRAWDIAFNAQGHIFAATEDGAILRSVDNGQNWTGPQGTFPPVWSITVSPQGHIYAGSQFDQLFRSTDNGANWAVMTLSSPAIIDGLAVGPDGTIYVSGSIGVGVMAGVTPFVGFYRSTNGGISWTDISAVDSVQVSKRVVIDPSGTLYVGAFYPGNPNAVVLMSTDRGSHWQTLSQEMNWGLLYGIAIDPHGRLYVATDDGVFMHESLSAAPEPEESSAEENILSVVTESNGLDVSIRVKRTGSPDARLQLIDMQGRSVQTTVLGAFSAGEHRFTIADLDLPQGIYLCRYIDRTHDESAKVIVR